MVNYYSLLIYNSFGKKIDTIKKNYILNVAKTLELRRFSSSRRDMHILKIKVILRATKKKRIKSTLHRSWSMLKVWRSRILNFRYMALHMKAICILYIRILYIMALLNIFLWLIIILREKSNRSKSQTFILCKSKSREKRDNF